jgi:hypothetical protein
MPTTTRRTTIIAAAEAWAAERPRRLGMKASHYELSEADAASRRRYVAIYQCSDLRERRWLSCWVDTQTGDIYFATTEGSRAPTPSESVLKGAA